MSELREWIVTLHRKEDLEDFYYDMENEGGGITIPHRRVEVKNRRLISRNTHYMLTDEDAALVKADPRVWDVELAELVALTTKPMGYTITNGEFDKSWTNDADDLNWGLLRHNEEDNRSNWGGDGTSLVQTDLTMTASGKNVDVVIVDGHIDPAHPEFAKNSDGAGGTRVVQYNWFQHTNEVNGGSNGTYVYTPYIDAGNADRTADNNHGCHCAGTVAGNTQGWARDANIYNISPYSTNPNSLSSGDMWDYIRAFHNNKSVNPDTGRKNPTITNNSYGSVIKTGATSAQDGYNSGNVTRVNYRGTDYNPGRDLTQAELQARGFYCPNSNLKMTIPYYFTSRQADIQDAINDGIIVVASAGNAYWKITNSTDQDYNNTYRMTYNGVDYSWYLNRGTGSGAGYAPVIIVGATSNDQAEDKAPFSNVGNQVDIFAAGEAIQSSLHSGGVADARNSSYQLGKYQGTSMSGPQVAGVLACLAESWHNMKQADAQTWLVNNASVDKMQDTEADDPMDTNSLQGGPNKYLRWLPQRPISGNNFPLKSLSYRPTSGMVYPRRRIQQTKYVAPFDPSDYTYSVTPQTNSVNEGSSLSFSVSVPNWPNDQSLYWRVGPSSREADFQFQSGNVVMTNGSGVFSVTPLADETTEGDETFNITLRTGSGSGTIQYTSNNYTISDTSQTPAFSPDYTLTAVSVGASAYTITGTDRNGAVSGTNPTLAFNAGDKVRFTVTASGHPFYVKTSQVTGTGSTANNVTNNGAESGNVDWTVGSAGTYYYICQFHSAMSNSITVS